MASSNVARAPAMSPLPASSVARFVANWAISTTGTGVSVLATASPSRFVCSAAAVLPSAASTLPRTRSTCRFLRVLPLGYAFVTTASARSISLRACATFPASTSASASANQYVARAGASAPKRSVVRATRSVASSRMSSVCPADSRPSNTQLRAASAVEAVARSAASSAPRQIVQHACYNRGVILACPTCDGRYDVTGYAPGQQFRCRCGTVSTLEAPASQAGLLRCPHCNAGVGPTSNVCAHCNSALLLKACPRCLARAFHGHEHCPTCGTQLRKPAQDARTASSGPCPRCETPLAPRLVNDIVIDECPHCQGIFLDDTAIERIITDRAQARADALLAVLPTAPVSPAPPSGKLYVKCPRCTTIMNRKQFATGAGVVIDVCKKHGTFFDVGELPAIISFVMHGGLERAAKADIAREREQARHELERARDAARTAAMTSAHAYSSTASNGGALIDLLFSLWR